MLSDGRKAVVAREKDATWRVSVAGRPVLSGYSSHAEARQAFDDYGAEWHGESGLGQTVVRNGELVLPTGACSSDEGHYFSLPPPSKGTGGETEGLCRHCGLVRIMNNVEPSANWRTGRKIAMI